MDLVINDKPTVLAYKLEKMLYGLRQSPRCWYEFLITRLFEFGLRRSFHDPCLFLKSGLFLAFYVDDGIYFGPQAQEFETFMKSKFELNEPCEIGTYTGYEFLRSPKGYFMHQTKFIEKLALDFNVTDKKTVFTPLPQSLNIDSPISGSRQDPHFEDIPYRSLVQVLKNDLKLSDVELETMDDLDRLITIARHNGDRWSSIVERIIIKANEVQIPRSVHSQDDPPHQHYTRSRNQSNRVHYLSE
jgi:hypothetical protein